jgi:hypothetical protein
LFVTSGGRVAGVEFAGAKHDFFFSQALNTFFFWLLQVDVSQGLNTFPNADSLNYSVIQVFSLN